MNQLANEKSTHRERVYMIIAIQVIPNNCIIIFSILTRLELL